MERLNDVVQWPTRFVSCMDTYFLFSENLVILFVRYIPVNVNLFLLV